jgi:hypothetical protein
MNFFSRVTEKRLPDFGIVPPDRGMNSPGSVASWVQESGMLRLYFSHPDLNSSSLYTAMMGREPVSDNAAEQPGDPEFGS